MMRVNGTQVSRLGDLLAAPLVCLVVFWRALFTWFWTDDFAWLGLRLQIHQPRDLLHVLFTPAAQGTVRVLSERVFFLVGSYIFGIHALPFRLCAFATWFADLALAAAIGRRLTGSRAAGLLAAILWTTSASVAKPLVWTAAFNLLLCALCLLGAFYSHLRWLESGERKWRFIEWAAYLAGFGAQETTVMYPALIVLYGVCVNRKRIWSCLPLFVPAALFAALHYFVIPKPENALYVPIVDSRIPFTFLHYLGWALGPSRIGGLDDELFRLPGIIATGLIGLALAWFTLQRLRRRDFRVVFLWGWFLALIAPVLPLPDHLLDYYSTLSLAGLAWLGGWAMVEAWSAGTAARSLAVFLAAAFFAGSIAEIEAAINWQREQTDHLRVVFRGVQDAIREHPGTEVLLQGVDSGLFQSGLRDNPFRLIGARVYLMPGSEKEVLGREPEDLSRYQIDPDRAMQDLQHGKARILGVTSGAQDITERYMLGMQAEFLATHRNIVDVGDPMYATRVGATWYSIENGIRWMPKTATIRLAGPSSPAEKLHVTGDSPRVLFASGPVTLRFRANGQAIGSAVLSKPEERFTLAFPLPADLVGQYAIEIAIEVSQIIQAPADQRQLGMVFGTFTIR